PGAVDRLRGCRDEDPEVIRIAAVDPANPYGALLDWPGLRVEGTIRRVAGATVILVGGVPALYVDKGGRTVRCFAVDDEILLRGVDGLKPEKGDRKAILIQKIDGEEARYADVADVFRQAGFVDVYQGLEFEQL
ncbi:MAG: hypothetical protein AAFV53_20615, partial [Myxococcota bacterium]